jgi:hypothetical protein
VKYDVLRKESKYARKGFERRVDKVSNTGEIKTPHPQHWWLLPGAKTPPGFFKHVDLVNPGEVCMECKKPLAGGTKFCGGCGNRQW